MNSGDGQRFTGFNLTVYLWQKAIDQNPANHFMVEESHDGERYTPVDLKAVPGSRSEFNAWKLTPAQSLKRGTSYLRISFKIRQVNQSWAAQIGRIKLEKQP